MFELPENTWWGSITGSNAKKYNQEIEQNQTDNLNKFQSAGNDITNILTDYGADSKGFAQKQMGESYNQEVGKVDNAFSQQQANAMSRATQQGSSVSSSAMYAQTKGEGMKQEALTSKENELQAEALQQSLAPHQNEQYNAQTGFQMVSSLEKKDERSVLNKVIGGGLSALGSSIPFF